MRYAWIVTGCLWWLGYASGNAGVADLCYLLGISVLIIAGVAQAATRPPKPPQMAHYEPRRRGRWHIGVGIHIPHTPFWAGVSRRMGR